MCYGSHMADKVLPLRLSDEDQKLVRVLQKALEKTQGKTSQSGTIRWALRLAVGSLGRGKEKGQLKS